MTVCKFHSSKKTSSLTNSHPGSTQKRNYHELFFEYLTIFDLQNTKTELYYEDSNVRLHRLEA